MAVTQSKFRALLGKRLRNLQSWLEDALNIGELRDANTIRLAKSAFLKLVHRSYSRGTGNIEEALPYALEMYAEHCVGWADKPETLQKDMHLSAEPAWESAEFHLLIASCLADHALAAFEDGTKGRMMLAAMLYADAVEARERWTDMRGPARARNPKTRFGMMHQARLKIDDMIAGKRARMQVGQNAAKARHANDPKHAAKASALELWKRRHEGKQPKLRTVEQFAVEVMRRWPVLTSTAVIRAWSAKWTKEVRAGKPPAC